jgi:hypothetical protein
MKMRRATGLTVGKINGFPSKDGTTTGRTVEWVVFPLSQEEMEDFQGEMPWIGDDGEKLLDAVFARFGDFGSAVVKVSTKKLVGIVFAGAGEQVRKRGVIFTPIRSILTALEKDWQLKCELVL